MDPVVDSRGLANDLLAEKPIPTTVMVDKDKNPVTDPAQAAYVSWWNADGSHGWASVDTESEPTNSTMTGNEGGDNCGTGAGGFRPGNTCGAEGGGSGSNVKMPPSKGGTTLDGMPVGDVVKHAVESLRYGGPVEVHDKEGWTFELAGREARAAADYNPTTNEINIYGKSLGQAGNQHVRELVAHEVQHAKYKAVMDQFDKDVKATNELPPTAFNRHGGLLPEYHDKYPTMARLDPILSDRGKLRTEDGVTEYSKAWWSQQRAGKCGMDLAVDETLAEVAVLRMRGNSSSGSAHYDKIYDIVHDEYNAIANGAKRTWVHDNWLASNAKEDRINTMDDLTTEPGVTADPGEYPRSRGGRRSAEVYVDENMNPVDNPSRAAYVSRWTDGRHVWARIDPSAPGSGPEN